MKKVSNWAGNVEFLPESVARPHTEDEVLEVLRSATERGHHVRVMGAGHSFTPLIQTSGTLVSLDGLSGLVGVDGNEATLWGGTRLRQVAPLLTPWGLALPNMGDVDAQSVAGAVSTGTHGTGLDYTGYSGMVTRLRLALPDGSVVECSREERPELFEAARVGLGTVGIILTVTLSCVPAFALRVEETTEPIRRVLDSFLDRSRSVDHLEFFWFPGTSRATVKHLERLAPDTDLAPRSTASTLVRQELLGNGVFGAMAAAASRIPGLSRPTSHVASRLMASPGFTDRSHRVFVTPRRVRFRETEYALPLEAFPHVVNEVERAVLSSGVPVTFPMEVRTAAADDTWIGTASGRESVYVAVHAYHRQPFEKLLAAVEPVFAAHEGRPHWGKEHTLDADDVSRLHPRADDVREVRRRVDPEGLLLNEHTAALLS